MNRFARLVFPCLVLTTGAAAQTTWHVAAGAPAPGDGSVAHPFPTLQAAFTAAVWLDAIEVGPGTYASTSSIWYLPPHTSVRSTSGAQTTLLTGLLSLDNVLLEGFTVTGAVASFESTVRRCIVRVAPPNFSWGILAEEGTTIDHCVVTGHDVPGVMEGAFAGGDVYISNTIFFGHGGPTPGWGTGQPTSGLLHLSACCVQEPVSIPPSWNVSPVTSDPRFFDAANGDYHLTAGSPCIAPDIGVFPFDPAYPTYATEECFGDGSLAACPCGNETSPLDRAGCRNTTGAGGTLRASGRASLFAPSVVLHGTSMPEGPLLYFQGTSAVPAFPFGNGIKCTGGALIRLGILFNVGGASVFPDAGMPSLSSAGFVSTAGSRTYQARYRDVMSMCSGENFNYTNAVRIDWHE